jgi:hypothetical protein
MRQRHLGAFQRADAVGEEAQLALRRDARIELAQAARRRIARIDEFLLAGIALARIQRFEIALEHQHFAAHVEHGRRLSSSGAAECCGWCGYWS